MKERHSSAEAELQRLAAAGHLVDDRVAIRTLSAGAARRRLRPGDVLFWRGEPGTSAHVVASGTLAIRRTSAGGDVVVLDYLQEGEFVGEIGALHGGVRTATVLAHTEAIVVEVRGDALRAAMAHDPGLTAMLHEQTMGRLTRMTDRVERELDDVDRRIDASIIDLCERVGRVSGDEVELRMTQQALADHLGLTRETVNKHLQVRARAGWLELRRGRIIVAASELDR